MSSPTPPNPASARRQWDREIFRLAIPAFGALVAEPVYVLVDTAIVGHLGTPQLAGLALAGQLLLSVYALFHLPGLRHHGGGGTFAGRGPGGRCRPMGVCRPC